MLILEHPQGTYEWLEAKIGVVGSTRMSNIITPAKLQLSSSSKDLILKLVDENITGLSSETFNGNSATDRGAEFEPLGRAAYMEKTGINIKEFGLCLDEKNPLHGLSPDGFTEDFKGAIEIKCPGFKHLKYIDENEYKNTTIYNDYKPQCINYFLINEKLEWLDTVSFRPEFYPNPIHIVRIKREDIKEDIEKVKAAKDEFFKNYNAKFESYTF